MSGDDEWFEGCRSGNDVQPSRGGNAWLIVVVLLFAIAFGVFMSMAFAQGEILRINLYCKSELCVVAAADLEALRQRAESADRWAQLCGWVSD